MSDNCCVVYTTTPTTSSSTSIFKFGLSVCLSICLFVSNKSQNGWTDRAQIFCGTSRDLREGLWMIKILKKFVLKSFWFLKNFENAQKNNMISANFFCFCFILYKPIGSNFFVGHQVTTGKVYEWSKFQIFVSIKIRSSLNVWK